MRRAQLLAGILALAGCPDDTATPGSTDNTGSTSVADTGTTGDADPSTGSTDAELPTTGQPTTGSSTTSTTDTTGITDTTDASSTGAPDPVCDKVKPCDACSCSDAGWACECPPLLPEAGFHELEPVKFLVGEGGKAQARTSSSTRLFYSFRPADPGVEGPLFVLFNGGPGSSTGTLMAFGTGPMWLTPEPAPNPGAWTTLGDLLYIDARGTGLSYNLADDPSDPQVRSDSFGINNYNSYLDAADFVRVVLRFLLAHPQLMDREVVLVGESYGGVRATIMLALLLSFADYETDGPGLYDDPALVAEIEAFLAVRDPGVLDWTPTAIAGVFPRQILIQPSLGDLQRGVAGEQLDLPGSPVFQLADELGLTFIPCSQKGPDCLPWANAVQFVESTASRSRYDLQAPSVWLANLFAAKKAGLSQLPFLEAILGVAPASVPLLPAAERTGAFRVSAPNSYPADSGDITELGALEPWDRYYIPFLAEANNAMRSALADNVGIGAGDSHYGALFLHNLAHVDTFITAAQRDIAIYAPSIPPTLALYDELVAGVETVPGEIRVQYVAAPFPDEPDPGLRKIRFPEFDASHAVGLDQPVALRDAVATWLAR
jgi:hypothetical protein